MVVLVTAAVVLSSVMFTTRRNWRREMHSSAMETGDKRTREARLVAVAILCAMIFSGSICMCVAQQITAHPQPPSAWMVGKSVPVRLKRQTISAVHGVRQIVLLIMYGHVTRMAIEPTRNTILPVPQRRLHLATRFSGEEMGLPPTSLV